MSLESLYELVIGGLDGSRTVTNGDRRWEDVLSILTSEQFASGDCRSVS